MTGQLISFEGGEGSGKSTQALWAKEYLCDLGLRTTIAREPGGVKLAESIRAILLDPEYTGMEHITELLLYNASRHELVQKVLRPMLEEYDVVIMDRFYDSTTAYQGYARGIDLDLVHQIIETAVCGLYPNLTLVFDINPCDGLARAGMRNKLDRLEQEAMSFHQAVRNGFLEIAKAEPDRVKIVDASPSRREVFAQVVDRLAPVIQYLILADG